MILVIAALYSLMPIQRVIKRKNTIRSYRIVCKFRSKTLKHYEEKFEQFGLEAERGIQKKTYEQISGVWIVKGPENNHEKAIKNIMNDPEVLEFDF
jgi:putative Mg2+ transporter-C (MgtC) family protein